MSARAIDTNGNRNISELNVEKKSTVVSEPELRGTKSFAVFKNVSTDTPSSDDDESVRTASSIRTKSKSTANAKTSRIIHKSSPSQSNTIRNLTHEIREMRDRICKLEEEVSTLHEVNESLLRKSLSNRIFILAHLILF